MEKVVVIVGQTSSGKSDLGIKLAKALDGEIVSADSRQVYKGLNYCSGKVSESEMSEVKHHLIDEVPLGQRFTLFDFQKKAYQVIDDIIKRGKLPILVGGTGLYSRAIVEGYNLDETEIDTEERKRLESLTKEELVKICGIEKIEIPDEVTTRRLVRLIEKKHLQTKSNVPKYDCLQIGIRWDRETIYSRIEDRLKSRMPFMIEEIKNLLSNGEDEQFLMSLGLEAKYILKYLNGEFKSFDEFFAELFKEERHFAKRQQTWYNKEKNIVWLDGGDDIFDKSKEIVEQFLKN